MGLGADTRITADGALSLFVVTASGFMYAIIWHYPPTRNDGRERRPSARARTPAQLPGRCATPRRMGRPLLTIAAPQRRDHPPACTWAPFEGAIAVLNGQS
jgi:hypothetical protein